MTVHKFGWILMWMGMGGIAGVVIADLSGALSAIADMLSTWDARAWSIAASGVLFVIGTFLWSTFH